MINGHGAEMIRCSSVVQNPKDNGNKGNLVLI